MAVQHSFCLLLVMIFIWCKVTENDHARTWQNDWGKYSQTINDQKALARCAPKLFKLINMQNGVMIPLPLSIWLPPMMIFVIYVKNLRKIPVWGKIRNPIKSVSQRQTQRVNFAFPILMNIAYCSTCYLFYRQMGQSLPSSFSFRAPN